MFYNAKNKTILIDGIPTSYVQFGYGKQPLIILPGLSDGLKTVKGLALRLAFSYKKYAKDYTVYIFSRKDTLQHGTTTKDMATDLYKAMVQLGLTDCFVMGVSQGGMIAQHFAILYPALVKKLVLAVTVAKPNKTIQNTIGGWVCLAKKHKYKTMMIDMLEKTYTEKTLQKYRKVYPLISHMGKPDNLERFLIQADACLTHNTYEHLHTILCPTLVIGGGQDKVVGKNTSQEIGDKIPTSQLVLYPNLGHATYEEAPDFTQRVLQFLGE